MQDKVDIIQQDPFRLVVAFHAVGALAYLFQLLLDVICNGLELPGVRAGANNKIVSKRSAVPVHFQNDNVFALLGFNGFYRTRNLLSGL